MCETKCWTLFEMFLEELKIKGYEYEELSSKLTKSSMKLKTLIGMGTNSSHHIFKKILNLGPK